ncbi:multicopper oxidase family protein [Streptomyces litchfieldiae]|uniref:Multicopper oxidase CueO n=1 Tax=Streptomyces litchfieldiae TaxID=3075543 RepID=A0ABU2MXQ8_9ACTN|nr:multicopper oxidase family protein [Streptomyces sp. DSM 44938]MDT0346421.1 multicopper oxidase family protein [Streptomyces sp. DSM 44938]
MKARPLSRRRVLQLAGGTAVVAAGVTACGELTKETTGKIVTSAAPLPEPFGVPLPIPQVARPVSQEGGVDRFEVEQRKAAVEILPGLQTTVWGYDGTFPGPTFIAQGGRTALVTVRNSLPVPTSTHLHGGVTPPDSDGYPTDLVLPVGSDPDAPESNWTPDTAHGMHVAPEDWTLHAGEKTYEYPLRQRAATLWYHDHRMDFSAPQVWRGLAGFFLVRDEEEQGLPLPQGERDIPLMICDRAFEEDGSFRYPSLDPSLSGEPGVESDYHSGVLGDVQLVNGAPWPVLDVTTTRYRFRLLNASNARRYQLTLEADGRRVGPIVQIGSDVGLLERPVSHDTITMAPAERFDVVVDFSQFPVDTRVNLVNTLEDGAMRQVMQFRVARRAQDDSSVPDRLLAEPVRVARSQSVRERTFDFRLTNEGGHEMWTVNGRPFSTGDSWANPRLDTVELWRFSSDFHHPVHLHLAHFQVISRNGEAPEPTDAGWKDTVDVRPYEVVEVLARFAGHKGRYMMHCHNLEHEDMAMMANFHVE